MAHTGEEVGFLLLKAVFIAAAFDTRQRNLQRHVEQDGEAGTKVALHPLFELGNIGLRQAAAAALVGEGGIGETVGHHGYAVLQRGQDNAVDMLGAGGKHEQGFGTQPGLSFRVEQQAAQGFAQGCAAWLAGEQDGALLCGKPFSDHGQLGGFAGAVDAVEGDEMGSHF